MTEPRHASTVDGSSRRLDRHCRIYVAGHGGMVGSAVLRRLQRDGIDKPIIASRDELDLRDSAAVDRFFRQQRPDVVVLAAARVGGIEANWRFPAEFIYDNLMIEANVLHAAHRHGVQRLLFLGSSCIYPREAPQPIPEEALLTGALEPTNAPYAVAKIAGLSLCEAYRRQHGCDFRALMPTNLYGPGDNFHPEHSHVMPALIRRFHNAVATRADEVVVWGTGTPRREFLHVDDLAEAIAFVLGLDRERFEAAVPPGAVHLNVGSGRDCTIAELARRIAQAAGFGGQVSFDPSRPDGTPRKRLDVSRLQRLGWSPKVGLQQGLDETWEWFQANVAREAVVR